MGAMWAPRAREKGYSPSVVRDAAKREEFILEVTPKDLRGSVIGDPENCTAARCIKNKTKYVWAWIGVSTAILGTDKGQLVRFEHRGHVPRKQDEGFFPVGSYKFGSPRPTNRIGERDKRRKPGQKGGADKVGDGSAKARVREMIVIPGGSSPRVGSVSTPHPTVSANGPGVATKTRKKPEQSLAQQFRH